MKEQLISVIIPIYNIERFVTCCVDSVLNQTYRNLEIILVDDGSTDKSGKICDEYSMKDSRIKVIHKENGGLSSARNAALDIMKGVYVFCIDGDDCVRRDLIEILYNEAVKYDADIVTSFYEKIGEDDLSLDLDETRSDEYIKYVCNDEQALERLLYQRGTTTSAWGKLYRANLFNGTRYPEGCICEDLPVTYRLFSKSKRIIITNTKGYYYRQRLGSILHSNFSKERFEALEFAREETSFIEKNYPEIRKAAYNREFMEAVFILESMPKYMITMKNEYVCEAWGSIISKRHSVLFGMQSILQYRVIAFASLFGLKTLYLVLKIKARLAANKYERGSK